MGEFKSTTLPLTLATSASSAKREDIDLAISCAVIPPSNSFTVLSEILL
jgi:hypothetical protein